MTTRDRFERWARSFGYETEHWFFQQTGGDYSTATMRNLWACWNAAGQVQLQVAEQICREEQERLRICGDENHYIAGNCASMIGLYVAEHHDA